MRISNREKIMLFILGIILVGFGYYNFIYSVQVSKIEEKLKQESQVKEKYETAMSTVNSLEDKKNDVELLKAKIEEKSKPFYPTISEEHIILEIDKLLKDSKLEGTFKFSPIVCDSVESVDDKNVSLPNSILQDIVDKYNNKAIASNDNSTAKSSGDNKEADTTKANNNDSNSNASKNKKKDTVQYVKFQVNFEGNYDGIYKFLSEIVANDRKIVVNSIKLSSDTLKGMKGTANLEIYSVPKIDDDLANYLKWDLNNKYGKDVPFVEGTGADISNETISNAKETKSQGNNTQSDFMAAVKSEASDLPKVIIGKTKDSLRTTYVYANSNSEEKAEVVFTQDGDKYYYKYKTSKGTYPTDYNGIGEEFIPLGKDISFNILSDSRVDGNDKSSLRLKVINKTDRAINVSIIGDDPSNPRVAIDKDGNNINVN